MTTKILTKGLFILSFLFVTISCNQEDGPEQVAEKFLNHLNKAEFDKAKEFCDEKSGEFLGMMAGMVGDNKPTEEEAGKIEIIKTEYNEDKTTAKVTYKNSKDEKENALDLIKVEDKWLVTINKEDMNKEQGAPELEEEGLELIEQDTTN
jgi:hypothetical protein